jgi:hypothetical protein
MDRKLITALVLGFLFSGFGLISFLVIISQRHPWFVEKKLRLGALILSLSGAAIGCTATSCYSPVPLNMVTIDKSLLVGDTIFINNPGTTFITGTILQRSGTAFSYAVLDSSDRIIFKVNILPVDGTFDESTEEFSINLDSTLPSGKYKLNFYEYTADSIENENSNQQAFPLRSYPLKIKA